MQGQTWRIWTGLLCAIITTAFFGLEFAFNVYAVALKETFNFSQTEVELVSACGVAGMGASLVEPFVTSRFGYRIGYLVIWTTSAGSAFTMSVAVIFKDFIQKWPVVVCFIQFLMNAGQTAGSSRLTTTSIQIFPERHTGKIVGLSLASVAGAKLLYGGVLQLFFPHDLQGFFIAVAVSQAISFGICFLIHIPEPDGFTSGSEGDSEESVPLNPGRRITQSHPDNSLSHRDDSRFRSDEIPSRSCDSMSSRDEFLSRPNHIVSRPDKIVSRPDENLVRTDDILSRSDNILSHQDEFLSRSDNILSHQDEIPSGSDNILSHQDEIPSRSDTTPSHQDEIPSRSDTTPSHQDEIVPGSDTILSHQDEIPSRSDNILSHQDEIPSRSHTILSHQNEIVSGSDTTLSHQDEILSRSDNILSHQDEILSRSDNILSHQDEILSRSDNILSHQDEILSRSDTILSHQGEIPSRSDTILSHSDEILSSFDKTLNRIDDNTDPEMKRSSYFHLIFWPSAVSYSILYTYMNNITSIARSVGVDQPMKTVYILSATIFVGRISFGLVFDKLKSTVCGFVLLLSGSLSIMAGISLLILRSTDTDLYIYMYIITVFVGLGVSVGLSIPASLLVMRFGQENMAYVIGCLLCFTAAFSLFSQFLTGVLYDQTLASDGFCYGSDCFFLSSVILFIVTTLATGVHVINFVVHCRGAVSQKGRNIRPD